MGPPTDMGHHTLFSLSPRRKKKKGPAICFQGKKIKPQIFKIFVPVSRLLLALASSQEEAPGVGELGGAQALRLRVLGPKANGGKGQMGASWAVGQDPSGDLGLFLNPFLPLLTSRLSGEAGEASGWDQRDCGIPILRTELEPLFMVVHYMETLDKATGGIIPLKPPPLPEWRACCPHSTKVKNGAERAGDESQAHSSQVVDLAGSPGC